MPNIHTFGERTLSTTQRHSPLEQSLDSKQSNERQMAECLVFQVILLREGLAIFIQYEPVGSGGGGGGGGGSMFLFAGTGQKPRCAVGDVATSLMRHPKYAGCKLLGSMRRDRVHEAWALCRAYVEDERHKHACVTDWCVAAAAMLEERRVVVAKKWWLLPQQRAESS